MKYFSFFWILCSQFLFAQISVDTLHVNKVNSYPIVFGSNNDKYPDSLYINGVIKDICFGVSCGVLCGSGTIKIKLSKLNHDFQNRNIFVVIPCLYGNNKKVFINKKVSLKVTKLLKNNTRCYFENITNDINSKSQPFFYYDIDRYGPFIIK